MSAAERLRALLRRLWRMKLVLAAGVLTGGEAAVSLGLDLPGSRLIPIELRGLAIALLGAAAFYMRWRAGKEDDRA